MPIDIDILRRVANLEKIRRVLISYFIKKVGKENMNRVVDPCILRDLTILIPPLYTKIEIVPHAEDMKLLEDQITIGWNLFVLGSQQMYLGRNFYSGIMHTVNQLKNGSYMPSTRPTEYGVTPKNIISFILRVLEKHLDGYVPWIEPKNTVGSMLNLGLLGMGYQHNYGMPSDTIR